MLERIHRIRDTMTTYGIHTLFVLNPKNVQYLSGFHTTARPFWQIGHTCCALSVDGVWKLFLPKPWSSEYQSDFPGEIVEYSGGLEGLGRLLKPMAPTDSRHKFAADLSWIPFSVGKELFYSFSGFPPVDEHPILAQCRMIKDPEEKQLLTKAVTILEKGLSNAQTIIAPGKTELEIQALINASMLLHGSEGNGFTTKVIAGINGSLPHHVSTTNQLSPKDGVIVDLSAIVHGYESDSARTFLMPQASSELLEVHQGITELLSILPGKLLPETPLHQFDHYIRDYLSKLHPRATAPDNIGHGVGLFAHEYPDICSTSSEQLKEGMILAIEPALYLPGSWGIRIENMFFIDSDGGHTMNHFPLQQTY